MNFRQIFLGGIAMKKIVIVLLTVLCGTSMACPTCIGVIEHNSPKFFSNDAYRSVQENQSDTIHASAITQEEEK
jgi:hypothetical protein